MNKNELICAVMDELKKERGGEFDISGEIGFTALRVYRAKINLAIKAIMPDGKILENSRRLKAVININSAAIPAVLNAFNSYIFIDGEKLYLQKSYSTSLLGFKKTYYTERYTTSLRQFLGRDFAEHLLFIVPFYGIAENEIRKTIAENFNSAAAYNNYSRLSGDFSVKDFNPHAFDFEAMLSQLNKNSPLTPEANFKINNYYDGVFDPISPVMILNPDKTVKTQFPLKNMQYSYLNNNLWGDSYDITAKVKQA